MSDMASVIVPKSDQLNADDLIAGPMTVKITGVSIRSGQEQPISISFEGDKGKPYKACKSMCRLMVTAWGADSKKYTGRSMTLYRDPSVKWGGMDVGGIRISHMSDIDSNLTMALTMTKGSRKPYTVRPLVAPKESAAPQSPATQRSPAPNSPTVDAADLISADQVAILETRCSDNGIDIADLKRALKVDALADIPARKFGAVTAWLDRQIDATEAA